MARMSASLNIFKRKKSRNEKKKDEKEVERKSLKIEFGGRLNVSEMDRVVWYEWAWPAYLAQVTSIPFG